jgi:predicted enzyme related to lactoylglutathione lyase
MGDYSDYSMKSPTSDMPTAGVCHARGVNSDLPPYWLVYITVIDLEQSMQDATRLGGRVVVPAKGMGGQGRYCVIQDPAGAVVALLEPAKDE